MMGTKVEACFWRRIASHAAPFYELPKGVRTVACVGQPACHADDCHRLLGKWRWIQAVASMSESRMSTGTWTLLTGGSGCVCECRRHASIVTIVGRAGSSVDVRTGVKTRCLRRVTDDARRHDESVSRRRCGNHGVPPSGVRKQKE